MDQELSSGDMELMEDVDVEKLSKDIEESRVDYLERSKHLKMQLNELKTEIEVLKVEEKQTQLDRIYNEVNSRGETKYTTLNKITKGSTRARVAFFEELWLVDYGGRGRRICEPCFISSLAPKDCTHYGWPYSHW